MKTFVTLAAIHLLAVMSPGPDFALIVRNSLAGSRRAGIWTAAGFALGIGVHVTYSLLGIGLVISQSILLFNAIKLAGAAYLIVIGCKALFARKPDGEASEEAVERRAIGASAALWSGFLCNALNPKATLFFLALFTQLIDPSTPLMLQALYGFYMSAQTFAWFSLVASVLSLRPIRERFAVIQHGFGRVVGGLLLALGINVALSARD